MTNNAKSAIITNSSRSSGDDMMMNSVSVFWKSAEEGRMDEGITGTEFRYHKRKGRWIVFHPVERL